MSLVSNEFAEDNGDEPSEESLEERRLTILYATQTGNSQDLAESLYRHALRTHFHTQCLSLDSYSPLSLPDESYVVFLISTTGDGENPDSMKPFWKLLLNRDIPPDFLDGVAFAVFGLGDSKYDKFCFPAKKLQRRLTQLGALEMMALTEADEQHPHGTDGIFLEWEKRLWMYLEQVMPLPKGLSPIPEDKLLPPRFSVVLQNIKSQLEVKEVPPPESASCVVKQNKRITAPGHWQDVRHIILEFPERALSYQPGDIAEVYPQNPKEEVDVFLDTLHWTQIADVPLTLTTNLTGIPLHLSTSYSGQPVITGFDSPTLRRLATSYLDICSVPRRSFFEMLKHFSSDESHVEKFAEFCTSEGQEELWDYTTRPRRTIVEVLADFWSSLQIPLEYVLDVFPVMKPRRFSIASSLKVHHNEIHLCVAIVKYKTNLKRPRYGVCTRWLAGLEEGNCIPVRIVEGGMRIPRTDVACLFVGPGTGIAPMRAMIEERIFQNANQNLLIFGNRNRLKDFLFESELEQYAHANMLSLITAFSRDGPPTEKKVYIQDMMVMEKEKVYDYLVRQNGVLYISGSSGKMPQGVKEAIVEILCAEERIEKESAVDKLLMLQKEGRFMQETW